MKKRIEKEQNEPQKELAKPKLAPPKARRRHSAPPAALQKNVGKKKPVLKKAKSAPRKKQKSPKKPPVVKKRRSYHAVGVKNSGNQKLCDKINQLMHWHYQNGTGFKSNAFGKALRSLKEVDFIITIENAATLKKLDDVGQGTVKND
eukprot:UN18808